jgi:DNA-binding CsgD family transcriptional regulator
MIAEPLFQRSGARVASFIQQYVKLAGAEHNEEVLKLFDKMLDVFPNWAIMTCSLMHPGIHYVSKNCKAVFGYEEEELAVQNKPEKFLSSVHPADQDDVFQCFNFMHEYLSTVNPELHCQYRGILHYRFRKKNGQYMFLHDERVVLNPGSGNLYFGLFRDITEEKNFTGVKVDIFRQEESLQKVAEFKPQADRNALTRREGELVNLLKQGLSTKEIAWYLNISHNTVRNIKSKLFEKYSVNNTVELLNMTG